MKFTCAIALLFGLLPGAQAAKRSSDAPKSCSSCEQWNRPHEPFHLFGYAEHAKRKLEQRIADERRGRD